MKSGSHVRAFATRGVLALALLGGCRTMRVQQREDNLAAAGFVARPANTPARVAMLKKLPPFHFVTRTKGDKVTYVYADPLVCGCLYVGNSTAYSQYKRDRMNREIANEQQLTAEEYNDASWDWGGWGPWDAQWGFSYGGGW